MSERIVSVKMPVSLVKELRTLTQQHHYLDLSEQIRSIVRQKALKYSQESSLLHDIELQIKESNQQRKEQLLQELQRLLEGGK
jgi:Arc/MetJ-type ribon-helix-helix transcriptional regulator